MIITTPTCMLCQKTTTVEIEEAQYLQWKNGALIQNVFPTMTPDERELLITGTHKECWDKLMYEGDEEKY